jgi:hypothetical protein
MLSTSLILIVILLVAGAIIGAVVKARLGNAVRPSGLSDDFQSRKAIFSPAERSFLGVLDGVLPEGVTWLGKVRLGDVFVTRKGLTASRRATAWNRINQKHVDFLLVRSRDFAPLAGIELDDRSHEENARKDRDAFVDQVFRSSNLPLLHIRAQEAYNQAQLRTDIAKLFEAPKRSADKGSV